MRTKRRSTHYELSARPVWAHACHCSRCRKSSGAAFAPNLFFPQQALRFVQGEDAIRRFKVPEAERFTHFFCGTKAKHDVRDAAAQAELLAQGPVHFEDIALVDMVNDAPVGQFGKSFQVVVPVAFRIKQCLMSGGPKFLDDRFERRRPW